MGRTSKFGLIAIITLAVIGYGGYKFAPFVSSYTSVPANFGALNPGDQAPGFELTDNTGSKRKLSDYLGKIVVLEWTNPLCEFTAKHYESGNMQALQKQITDQGVIWLAINTAKSTSASFMTPQAATERMAKFKTSMTALLLDETTDIGRLYGSRATPGIFIIDEAGIIAYHGGVDDDPWGDGNIKNAQNYVIPAIANLIKKQPIETPVTKAYGCSVTY